MKRWICSRALGQFSFKLGLVLLLGCVKLIATELPGFTLSPVFNEQVSTFRFPEEITFHLNAPAADEFDPTKPVGLALFALPNGNTIEQTVGKVLEEGDDWHFDIQHIGAQARFLRNRLSEYNLVVVYLEADQKSWPTWKASYSNYEEIIQRSVDHLLSYFGAYDPFVILTGHSGGGRYVFSFLDGVTQIPDYVKRICFLDSNYGYEHSYGDQFIQWLNAAPDHYLSVLAYNDSIALYNGQPIVSPTGGTWYRSRIMQQYLAQTYSFNTVADSEFIWHTALNGRIQIILKQNPERKILHTVQVERNGFIQTMVSGTELEESGYSYYGDRAYSDLIQTDMLERPATQIPLRRSDAKTGSEFMQGVKDMTFQDRESAIQAALFTGNIPYFMRQLKIISMTANDANGAAHTVEYRVMPDYLSIGVDSNYCRVPMGPITAQRAADFFGFILPTPKLVDNIYANAEIRLAPVTYPWEEGLSESVGRFVEHNDAIEGQLQAAGASRGQLVGGTKKDVVLSNKIVDPSRDHHVVIYGWHKLDGAPIQPVYNGHINTYVDYSHGIRYLSNRVEVDGTAGSLRSLLQDPVKYKLFSNEAGPMPQPTYIADAQLPEKPGSFGVLSPDPGKVTIKVLANAAVSIYRVFTSPDGISFSEVMTFSGSEQTLTGLPEDEPLYIRLQAENAAGSSLQSEVLAVTPSGPDARKILVVNAYDRPKSENSFDFIRQHAQAIAGNGIQFEAATNEALLDGLMDLQDYLIVDVIMGEESTIDETFSDAEQLLFKSYLQRGGRLFLSGAEIAWDLDYKGTSTDKAFIHDYLKAAYSADAPGGVAGVTYTASGLPGTEFGGLSVFNFDDGTHGSYNVNWPDALTPQQGSHAIARYEQVNTHTIAGIAFEGMFPNGLLKGRLLYLGFPFETIFPEDRRMEVMDLVLTYLAKDPLSLNPGDLPLPDRFALTQNYPNPFNPSTTIRFGLPRTAEVTLSIHDLRGRLIRQLHAGELAAGWHERVWNGEDAFGKPVAASMYICQMLTEDQISSIKVTYLK